MGAAGTGVGVGVGNGVVVGTAVGVVLAPAGALGVDAAPGPTWLPGLNPKSLGSPAQAVSAVATRAASAQAGKDGRMRGSV